MNNNQISCNVIIDLLPLYKEAICSEETRILVDEHLQSCKSCRSLSESLIVPEPEFKSAPTEAETFKKVGKKLKRSRLTKVMSVVMCICIVLFAAVNGAWYFLKYRPMKQMCKEMYQVGANDDMSSVPNAKKLAVYISQDDDYVYIVRLPHYLNFTMGTVTVAQIGAIEIDENGMTGYNDTSKLILTIPHKIFGTEYYFVTCDSDSSETTYTFESDTEFSKAIVNVSEEETSEMNKILETHKNELNDMKNAALEKCGKNF